MGTFFVIVAVAADQFLPAAAVTFFVIVAAEDQFLPAAAVTFFVTVAILIVDMLIVEITPVSGVNVEHSALEYVEHSAPVEHVEHSVHTFVEQCSVDRASAALPGAAVAAAGVPEKKREPSEWKEIVEITEVQEVTWFWIFTRFLLLDLLKM